MSKKNDTQKQAPGSAQPSDQEKAKRRKLTKNTYFAVGITAILMITVFLGKWVWAIKDGCFSSIVQRDSSVGSAMASFETLTPTEAEAAQLLPLQKKWDIFTSSRLRDEVTATAQDGVPLHGYLYNEGSDVTVIVLPKYHDDGTADFLPGSWLNEKTGCNIFMPDPRGHGESGGAYVGFGVLEQYDLACWIEWCDNFLGEQTYLIWGVGTGANTALFAANSGLLPDSVALIVAESPYASFHELAKYMIWEVFEVPTPFLYPVEWELASSDAGYTVADMELADRLEKGGADVPVIFLVSETDEYILPGWSSAVYDAYQGEKKLISGGGGHGTVYAACKDEVHGLLGEAF